MSFVRRRIEATIQLGKGKFGDTKGDTVKLSGLRMAFQMHNQGQEAMGQAQLRIYGLPLDMINRLTSVGPINSQLRGQNRLIVQAGDVGGQLATVFNGSIDQAWGEFEAMPDVVLNVSGLAGLIHALKPVSALSFQGSADVADICAGLAKTMGLTFENNGVSVILSNPNFPGTGFEQLKSATRAAGVNFNIDCDVLAIWPKRGARSKGVVPVISKNTGLVGYPSFTSMGVDIVSLFAPTVKQGMQLQLESQLTPANGIWNVLSVNHALESETPGGRWFTLIQCGRIAA